MNRVSRILVCGGRKYNDYRHLSHFLNQIAATRFADKFIIIHGGAKGADSLAATWASQQLKPSAKIEPLWGSDPFAAGLVRNEMMLLLVPELVIAFPGGSGTRDMIEKAKAECIEVIYA